MKSEMQDCKGVKGCNVRRALAFSLVERYLLLVLGLASNMVIARLLLPEQIGVYSVSLAVLGIAQALRDFGIGNYLIQERSLGEDQIRTAFGVSLILGGVLFAIATALAPLAANYYNEPRMELTLRISSLNLLLLPFSTVSLSLLRREMQFKKLLYVAVCATLATISTSIVLAAFGVGENSLAVGAVVGNLITGFGAWIVREDRKVLRPSLRAWRVVVRFGGQSSLASLVTSVSMDANDLIVGKTLGFQPVAMLSRAQGLMNLFHRDLMGAVRNVALPAFATSYRDGVPLCAPFLRGVAIVLAFAWPFYGLVSIYALEVIDFLYGKQWLEAAPLVPIFCLAGAFAAVNALTPNLIVAVGRIDLITKVELSMQPLRVVFIAFAAVVYRSIEACALAYLASAVLTMPVMWWFKSRCVENDTPQMLRYLGSSACVAIATLFLPLLQVTWFGWSRTQPIIWWQWIPVALCGALLGALTVGWSNHPLARESAYKSFFAFFGYWSRELVKRFGS